MTHTPESTPTLQPCPFCGGEVLEFMPMPAPWGIVCRKCGAETCLADTKAEAIAAWNTRRTPPTSQSDNCAPCPHRWPWECDDCAPVSSIQAEASLRSEPTPASQSEALVDAFNLAHELIQEAKGAEGDMAYVTSHLDEAENWLDRIEALLKRELAKAKADAEMLAEALVELKGQVEQARDGFDRWPYNNSPSMKHSLTGAAKALAAWEKSRG